MFFVGFGYDDGRLLEICFFTCSREAELEYSVRLVGLYYVAEVERAFIRFSGLQLSFIGDEFNALTVNPFGRAFDRGRELEQCGCGFGNLSFAAFNSVGRCFKFYDNAAVSGYDSSGVCLNIFGEYIVRIFVLVLSASREYGG